MEIRDQQEGCVKGMCRVIKQNLKSNLTRTASVVVYCTQGVHQWLDTLGIGGLNVA